MQPATGRVAHVAHERGNDVTEKVAADVLLIVSGVGVLVVWLLAAEAAVWLIRTRTRSK